VGVVLGGVAKAWPVETLRGCQVEVLGDRGVVICRAADGGLSAFEPRIAGKSLPLGVVEIDGRPQLLGSDGTLVDPSGKISVGILAGTDLPAVDIVETRWSAWSSYYPNSLVDGRLSPPAAAGPSAASPSAAGSGPSRLAQITAGKSPEAGPLKGTGEHPWRCSLEAGRVTRRMM
jgi:hypothetical protein